MKECCGNPLRGCLACPPRRFDWSRAMGEMKESPFGSYVLATDVELYVQQRIKEALEAREKPIAALLRRKE